jgi:basic membrane protein A
VDSDQHHLAPDAVLTSMVKRVDLAVYEAAKATAEGSFTAEDTVFGLAQQGVGLAEVRVDFPKKAEALAKVEALRQRIVSGALKIPSTPEALQAFKAEP